MARYYNTQTTSRTLTFTGKKVVTFPGRKWSEAIPSDEEGHAGLLKLVKEGVLKRDPLARLKSEV